MRGYDWELDVPKRRARVAPAGKGKAAFGVAGLHLVPLQTLRAATGFQLLSCSLQIRRAGTAPGAAGTTCLAVLDHGAPFTICSQATATALGLGDRELRNTGKVVSGMDGNPMPVREATFVLAVGGSPAGTVEVEAEVVVGDLPIFQALGLTPSSPVAILGLDVLGRSRHLTLPAAGELWLQP